MRVRVALARSCGIRLTIPTSPAIAVTSMERGLLAGDFPTEPLMKVHKDESSWTAQTDTHG
jgi:hypothetical protein